MSCSNLDKSMQSIKSGDILFFSNNTPTGLTLRTFTSTLWSHTGIAIRLIEKISKSGHVRNIVSTTEEGILYIMEINARVRFDQWTRSYRNGFGLSSVEFVLANQTIGAVRRMDDIYRTSGFAYSAHKFIQKFHKAKFPLCAQPFIGAWLGYPMDKLAFRKSPDSPQTIELFCSEMMAYFYIYTLTPTFQDYNSQPLKFILGAKCPHRPDIVAPRHFEPHNSLDSKIFKQDLEIFAQSKEDLKTTLFFPVLSGTVLGVILWLSLPGNSWSEMM